MRNLQHSKFNFFLCKRIIVFDFLLFSLDFSFFFFGNFWQFGRLFFLPLVEFFGVDCNCILTPLLLAPVRCEVERAGQLSPRRDRKGGGGSGFARGLRGSLLISHHHQHHQRGRSAFFFFGTFSRSFSVLLHSGLLFFGTFYLLFAAHKLEHTHRGARTSGRKKKCIKKGYNRVGKFEILLQAVV